MSLAVAIVAILILTALVAVRVRGRRTPAPAVAIVYGLVVSLGLVGIFAYNDIQEQRLRDQCAYNVARSDGNRQQWLDLSVYLEGLDVAPDAIAFIREHLDVNLPQRTVADCVKP